MGMWVCTQVDSRMVPIPHSKNRPTLVITNINFKSIKVVSKTLCPFKLVIYLDFWSTHKSVWFITKTSSNGVHLHPFVLEALYKHWHNHDAWSFMKEIFQQERHQLTRRKIIFSTNILVAYDTFHCIIQDLQKTVFLCDSKFSSSIFMWYNPRPIWVSNQRLSNSVLFHCCCCSWRIFSRAAISQPMNQLLQPEVHMRVWSTLEFLVKWASQTSGI